LILETLGRTITVYSDSSRLVKIDYVLAPLLKPTESNLTSMPRDKLLDRLLESSTSYYTITTGTESQTRFVSHSGQYLTIRKGKPPKISIVMEKRQGRKTVTRFWGLEAFFINPNDMAEELRNACATSASVAGTPTLEITLTLAVQGATPKLALSEVMIQGPQANSVIDALERRGVKKTFIVLQDKRK
jgi:translation initiation factor 2D